MHLLLVDDDPVTRLTLSGALTGWGHEVTVAVDGVDAWGILQLAHFPVVVSDWQMPGLEGVDLCRRLRARADAQYVYFILVTSAGGRQRYFEGMNAGADDFITKPVDLEELQARLTVAERILGLRRQVQQLEGLLPICAYCKRIRDQGEEWQPIEQYVEARSEAQFSHGYCPECYEKYVRPQIEGA